MAESRIAVTGKCRTSFQRPLAALIQPPAKKPVITKRIKNVSRGMPKKRKPTIAMQEKIAAIIAMVPRTWIVIVCRRRSSKTPRN